MATLYYTSLPVTGVSRQGILWLCILFSHMAFAQQQNNVTTDTLALQTLSGFTQTYRYSDGHKPRAESIAVFMESAGKFFQQELGFTPRATLYILAPKHWKAIAAEPLREVYGFPHNIDHYRLAIAAEDNDFWRSFLPPINNLPAGLAAQLKTAYGKPDGSYSMMPFFDLLALHELGHSYTAQAGLTMQRHWMSELFVNIMLHTYVAEKQPERLPALETFPSMVVGGGSAEFTYTTLEDFERLYETLGMGPKNYGWYQCRLHSAAKEIYQMGGKKVMVNLWKALKHHKETMSDKELVQMLQTEVDASVANVFLNWDKQK